jgi:pre-mRNA-processing factor 19
LGSNVKLFGIFVSFYNRIMSALACSISGAPLTTGVVSSKTGHLYEKSTILHYIALHGTCPHTGAQLTASDLVGLTPAPVQVLPSQQSIPSLVEKLQGELDALILETHMLKQNLRERREELATSLYRQDAAIRVIARLTEQRDQDRERIATLMQEIRDR